MAGRAMGTTPHALVRDRRPLYLQAVEAIQTYVSDRGLVAGERLPSEVELGALLGVGRSTIREAMGHLELARVVERRRGVGTVFLGRHGPAAVGLETLESLESLAARQGWRCQTNDIQIRPRKADAEQARRLEIEPGSPVSIITRTKARDGVPLAEMESVIPASVIPMATLQAEFEDSITELMTRRRSPHVRFARAEVTAVSCDARRAHRLGVATGNPLLVMDEVFLGEGEQVLAWNVLYFVPRGIRLEVIRRAGPGPRLSPGHADGAVGADAALIR
ncbi:MAG TPA: GntR family transcriptional regulator [Actinomycetota bacterium]|jgi:DNA-binding GntR family transcriptional regulator|nr:GntR family transcriptional regulator [Actinomycetota bacterium]